MSQSLWDVVHVHIGHRAIDLPELATTLLAHREASTPILATIHDTCNPHAMLTTTRRLSTSR